MKRCVGGMIWLFTVCVLSAGGLDAQTLYAAERAVSSQAPVSPRLVTLELKNVTVAEAVLAIARQAGVPVAVGDDVLASARRVDVRLQREALQPAIQKVLIGTVFQLQTTASGALFVNGNPRQVVEDGVVTGRIVHEKTKQPVARARITVGEDGPVVETGSDGAFRLSVKPGSQTLVVRALGFVRWSKVVVVESGKTVTVAIELAPSASVLDEVIVTGTVVATERKAIANPITVFTAEDIERRGITRVEQLLRGEVPGVLATEQGSLTYSPGVLGGMESTPVFSRGVSNTAGGSSGATPLKTFVDGVELLDPSYLGTLDPQMIERIEIIAGPQAATVYGSGALGGVMQIFTKKGSDVNRSEVSLTLKYGLLENSYTSSLTPAHNDVLTINGGDGPRFSYTAGISYLYSGQWQPFLFSRRFGGNVGVTRKSGSLTTTGSVTTTVGSNGTFGLGPGASAERAEGRYPAMATPTSGVRSGSSSQTVAFGLDYQLWSFWQHRVTIGRSGNSFELEPVAPALVDPSDTLFRSQSLSGQRTSMGYNTSLWWNSPSSLVTSALTVGVTGSQGKSSQFVGCTFTSSSRRMEPCGGLGISVVRPLNDKSVGGFGSLQVGLLRHFFLTLGLRGEQNPTYGRERKIDWTPTNGVAATLELDDLTVKLMGSYGRATRAPNPDRREQQFTIRPDIDPSVYLSQLSNPELRPEHSQGPQGGVEVYYGNLLSFSVNHYQQRVSDYIVPVVVDSFFAQRISDGRQAWIKQIKNLNGLDIGQRGWEGSFMVRLGRLLVKGTMSHSASTIVKVVDGITLPDVTVGKTFVDVPSPHFGNLTLSYATGSASVTLSTSFVGKGLGQQANVGIYDRFGTLNRLRQYISRSTAIEGFWPRARYSKSDLSVIYRLHSQASLTMNVTNLTNAFDTDIYSFYPSLGRRSELGVQLRWP